MIGSEEDRNALNTGEQTAASRRRQMRTDDKSDIHGSPFRSPTGIASSGGYDDAADIADLVVHADLISQLQARFAGRCLCGERNFSAAFADLPSRPQ